ncbi:MAG: hypothetical protein Q9M26_07340 [Mariprofundales bacterium]|nr:hypothetical protein [Mariprofundales bacterium]
MAGYFDLLRQQPKLGTRPSPADQELHRPQARTPEPKQTTSTSPEMANPDIALLFDEEPVPAITPPPVTRHASPPKPAPEQGLLTPERSPPTVTTTTSAPSVEPTLLFDEKPEPEPAIAPQPIISHDTPPEPNPLKGIVTSKNEQTEVESLVSNWIRTFIALLYNVFRICRLVRPNNLQHLAKHIKNLILWLERDPSLINALELELIDFAKYERAVNDNLIQLVMKSVMLMLYAIKTTSELKSPHDTRIRLIMATVLHHIGMAQVPPAILSKKGRLSPDELAEIRAAPSKGAAYLQSCGIDDEYILRATAESNERIDGSGPRGLQANQLCPSSKLVSLLSMFEAMIHFRTYRKRMLPREAVRIIVNKYKPTFDRPVLKALLDAISLYPVGSHIKLNSHEIGRVIFAFPRLPLRPRVLVTMDDYGNAITPREIDLKNHPNLMIQQCVYEEDLDELKHDYKPTKPQNVESHDENLAKAA